MDRRSQLEGMNRKEGLIPIAKELKVKNYGRLPKKPLIDEILKYEAGFRPIKKDSKKQLRQTAKILGANPRDDLDELLQIVTEYHKTLSSLIGMSTRKELEKAIAECEKRRLDLSDEGIWHGAYIPPIGTVENQQYYEGFKNFTEIQIKLTRTGEPLIGAGKVVEWLVHSKSVYGPPEKQDDVCFWRCLAAFFKFSDLKRLETAAKDPAKRCLGRTHLSKKVSMETISEAAQTVDITRTVYKPT